MLILAEFLPAIFISAQFMSITFKKIVFVSSLFCAQLAQATNPASGLASLNEISPPLMTAGIFRIETERSYKLSLQVTLGILSLQSSKDRDRSVLDIVRMRNDLSKLKDKSTKTTKALSRVNSSLDEQLAALPKLNHKTAAAMYDVNEDLLVKMNFLSFALESETSDNGSRIVGLALRQASLAQRMAKIALLRSVDKNLAAKQGLQVDLAQSKIEFANGLALLMAETNADQFLKDRVSLAQQQWVFYQAALASSSVDASDLRNISTTSDRIAEVMIEIVRLGYAMVPDPSVLAGRVASR